MYYSGVSSVSSDPMGQTDFWPLLHCQIVLKSHGFAPKMILFLRSMFQFP